MIVLPHVRPDPMPTDRAQRAGIEAESQMAHYLARAFEETPRAWVFHGLRLVLGAAARGGDDAVQIDHLILHKHGMVIVESKSVACEVQIDDRGEWTRTTKKQTTGMPSPVQQTKRQAEALRTVLNASRDTLLDKVFGKLQATFSRCPIEVFVAISDKGIVGRAKGVAPKVMKADQICDAVRERILLHRRSGSLTATLLGKRPAEKDAGMWSMKDAEMARVCDFLLAKHTPLSRGRSANSTETVHIRTNSQRRTADVAAARTAPSAATAQPAGAAAPTVEAEHLEPLTCRHCNSINVQIVYARDYCLKCSECEKYTPLDRTCTVCGAQARITKKRDMYSRVCGCGSQVVFFRN